MYSPVMPILTDYKTTNRAGIRVALKGDVHVVSKQRNVGVASPIRITAGVFNPPTIVSTALFTDTVVVTCRDSSCMSLLLHTTLQANVTTLQETTLLRYEVCRMVVSEFLGEFAASVFREIKKEGHMR
jgi:hypothetical protein